VGVVGGAGGGGGGAIGGGGGEAVVLVVLLLEVEPEANTPPHESFALALTVAPRPSLRKIGII